MTAIPSHSAPGASAPSEGLAEAIQRLDGQLGELEARVPAVLPSGDAAALGVAPDLRRREIAQALRGVRRRNRIAIGALAASCAMSFAGFCALWWVKAQESKDPVVPVFRMPIELRTPFEFVKSETNGRTGSAGGAGATGGPAPSSDSGSVSK